AHHPEVIGTVGQLPAGAITLVQSVEEVARFVPRDPSRLAYVTQTTLSVDDTADIVAALKQRFPDIHGPHREDICYATTNRRELVAALVSPTVSRATPRDSKWPSIPTWWRRSSRPFSPITTSVSCSPTKASRKGSRIPTSSFTPAAAFSSSPSTRGASRPGTCRFFSA